MSLLAEAIRLFDSPTCAPLKAEEVSIPGVSGPAAPSSDPEPTADPRKAFFSQRLIAVRAKYPDFDTVTAADPGAGTGLLLTPAMIQFLEVTGNFEVIHQLGRAPVIYRRILSFTPELQLAALCEIEDYLALLDQNLPHIN